MEAQLETKTQENARLQEEIEEKQKLIHQYESKDRSDDRALKEKIEECNVYSEPRDEEVFRERMNVSRNYKN